MPTKSIWIVRVFFLVLCALAGYAIGEVDPALVKSGPRGILVGCVFGGLLIGLDEFLKGFSLRAFSAATFGLLLGGLIAWLVDTSGLFVYVEDPGRRWLFRLGLFVTFGYIGMVLAMRSNKEDFSLILPYVRFSRQNQPDNLLLLDTSAVIDGRVADLLEHGFLEGIVVVPRFVLQELQRIAESTDPIRRSRGRRGLEMLSRMQRDQRHTVKIHEGDFPEDPNIDAKLLRLASALKAKLITTDHNLGKVAELQSIPCLNIQQLAGVLKPVIQPGEVLSLKLVREGKEKGQGVGYLNDGVMVVVNNAAQRIGQQVDVQVQSLLQTGAGVIVFAEFDAVPVNHSAPSLDSGAAMRERTTETKV